jgi:hypothetical protein
MTRSSPDRVARRIDVPSRKVWPGMEQMISDYESLEKSIRDMRNVLAVIAYQQEDHILSVPVSALQALPAGCELEVSFDRAHDNYNFKCIVPQPKGDEVDDPKTD